MNLDSINYKFFLDNDHNPFIIFDQNSKILYLNYAAEVLLGHVDKREIFDIALSHAPKDFGSKTTNKEFIYNHLCFYALSVSYEDEDAIGIKFYEKPKIAQSNENIGKFKQTDIHLLLEAALLQFKTKTKAKFSMLVDYDFPAFLIAQNDFSKILRKIFNEISDAKNITVTMKIKVGEYRLIAGNKHSILKLQIGCDQDITCVDQVLKSQAKDIYIDILTQAKKITMLIPMIRELN
jgi:hypothetical protein